MANHIERRHQTWYAVLNIPKDAQRKLRRKRFRVSLKTQDATIAKRRAMVLVADWKGQIASARGQSGSEYDAEFWRGALKRAGTEEQRQSILEQIDMAAWDIGATNVDQIGQPPSSAPEARQFYAEATGAITPTPEHLDEWLASLQVKTKTANMRRATIHRLAGKFPMLQDVTRGDVRRWVTQLTAELKPSTVQRMLSDCRTYWAYLVTIEVMPEDSEPFDKLGLKVEKSSWLPFDPEDVAKLLHAARDDEKLCDLIRLAMYTGARREELCSLRVEHCGSDRFDIIDAKTAAGIRTVPIHSELKQTIARLIDESTDGYLLSGLAANKNGDRGDMLGKRFARLKKRLGFSDRQVFHSFRGTVITILERAGMPEGTVQDIVGHERSTLTGSTYSGKSTFEMRVSAIEELRYPA